MWITTHKKERNGICGCRDKSPAFQLKKESNLLFDGGVAGTL